MLKNLAQVANRQWYVAAWPEFVCGRGRMRQYVAEGMLAGRKRLAGVNLSLSVICRCLSQSVLVATFLYRSLSGAIGVFVVTPFCLFPGNMNTVEYEFCGPWRANLQLKGFLQLLAVLVVAVGQ